MKTLPYAEEDWQDSEQTEVPKNMEQIFVHDADSSERRDETKKEIQSLR